VNLETVDTIRELAGGGVGDPPTLTRRTRKRNERRDRVFDAAIWLFVENGFDETSMDDIATRSELARTTVFNHFPRKVMILEEWTLRRRQRAARFFADADPTGWSVREVLGGYLAALARVNEEARVETTALMLPTMKNTDVLVNHPLARDLADLVAEAGAPLRPSADPQQVGRLLALGYFSAVTRWIGSEPAPFDLAEELAKLLDVVLHGAVV
jgi:AcrR family transcriptional regulator